MSKKNRGKDLFPKSLPRISLIISIQRFIPQQQPEQQPNVRWARGRVNKKHS